MPCCWHLSSIDSSQFLPEDEISGSRPQEPAVSVAINADARAYPLSGLIWYEIVNDTVGGTPIVFDRRLEGQVLDFGVGMRRAAADQ